MKSNNNILLLALCVFFIIGIVVMGIIMMNSNANNSKTLINNTNITEIKMNTKVKFTTNYGEFEVELFTEKSPITAGNFQELVENGFYDGTRFHRVIDGFMIQGGDPQSKNESLKDRWGTGGPGYSIEDEFIQNLSNVVGTLSMANSGPQSGGSQFFINVADNTFLDFNKEPLQSKHPVFGKVVEGMDVVVEISKVQTEGKGFLDRPTNDVIIEKIEVIQ